MSNEQQERLDQASKIAHAGGNPAALGTKLPVRQRLGLLLDLDSWVEDGLLGNALARFVFLNGPIATCCLCFTLSIRQVGVSATNSAFSPEGVARHVSSICRFVFRAAFHKSAFSSALPPQEAHICLLFATGWA